MALVRSFPVLVIVLLIAITACGGSDDADVSGGGTTVGESGAPASEGAVGGGGETTSGATAPSPTTGGLDVRVTDAPPEGVTRIDITVSNIDVHKADVEEGEGWITVFPISTSTPQTTTFDLVEVTGVEGVLAQLEEFAVGKYTQIRMEVVTVSVTVNGEDKEARVPSGTVKVVRPFDVEAGQNTILTLDFDAAKSVVITGTGDIQFKPTVKLLIRKEERSKSAEQGQAGDDRGEQGSEKREEGQATGGQAASQTQGQSAGATPKAGQQAMRPADSSGSKTPLTTAEHPDMGTILVDREGFTLYAFTSDEPNSSNCTGGCATTWPPLHSDGATELAGDGADADLVGTMSRTDGTEQVTYGDRPLYNFSGDRDPGDTRGAGVGGVWFAVSPEGELVN